MEILKNYTNKQQKETFNVEYIIDSSKKLIHSIRKKNKFLFTELKKSGILEPIKEEKYLTDDEFYTKLIDKNLENFYFDFINTKDELAKQAKDFKTKSIVKFLSENKFKKRRKFQIIITNSTFQTHFEPMTQEEIYSRWLRLKNSGKKILNFFQELQRKKLLNKKKSIRKVILLKYIINP